VTGEKSLRAATCDGTNPYVEFRKREAQYGQSLVVTGNDKDCRFIWACRELRHEKSPVVSDPEALKTARLNFQEHGSARNTGAACATENRIARDVTMALLEEPDSDRAQLDFAAALGQARLVDYLLEEGKVSPMWGFEDNSVMEKAAAMGNVDVVKSLLAANYAPPSMYSVVDMGMPPVDAALKVIGERRKMFYKADVTRHWKVVEEILSKGPGQLAGCSMGKIIVTAPLDLFFKIADNEPEFMKNQAPTMAAHLLEKQWDAEDFPAKLEVVKTFLPDGHPLL
jgi:hypothetical protein